MDELLTAVDSYLAAKEAASQHARGFGTDGPEYPKHEAAVTEAKEALTKALDAYIDSRVSDEASDEVSDKVSGRPSRKSKGKHHAD